MMDETRAGYTSDKKGKKNAVEVGFDYISNYQRVLIQRIEQ